MTYYPSFQAYIDNVYGKVIDLAHVTVKLPGKKHDSNLLMTLTRPVIHGWTEL